MYMHIHVYTYVYVYGWKKDKKRKKNQAHSAGHFSETGWMSISEFLAMLKMFKNFFKDLSPYALNWREEIYQETWIFAKFVKNSTIKPNYTSFKKFAMHSYSIAEFYSSAPLSTPSWACSGQVSADIHASRNLCVRIRGSSKRIFLLEE